jgi:hypothetical protein
MKESPTDRRSCSVSGTLSPEAEFDSIKMTIPLSRSWHASGVHVWAMWGQAAVLPSMGLEITPRTSVFACNQSPRAWPPMQPRCR